MKTERGPYHWTNTQKETIRRHLLTGKMPQEIAYLMQIKPSTIYKAIESDGPLHKTYLDVHYAGKEHVVINKGRPTRRPGIHLRILRAK